LKKASSSSPSDEGEHLD